MVKFRTGQSVKCLPRGHEFQTKDDFIHGIILEIIPVGVSANPLLEKHGLKGKYKITDICRRNERILMKTKDGFRIPFSRNCLEDK